jgi:hypothetical protein
MPEMSAVLDLKSLLKFPFQGKNWQNPFVIGSAFILAGFFIPIIPLLFVQGYFVDILRRSIRGEHLLLPPWQDWGKLLMDGLHAFVVGFIYLLPATIILVGGFGLYFASSFAVPIMATFSRNVRGIDTLLPIVMFTSFAILMVSMLLGNILWLIGAIPLPVAISHMAAKEKLSAAFHIHEYWPLLRSNKLGYFICWVVLAGLAAILYFLTLLPYLTFILCFLIPFIVAPGGFYMTLIAAALFGQTYRESTPAQAPAAVPAVPAAE